MLKQDKHFEFEVKRYDGVVVNYRFFFMFMASEQAWLQESVRKRGGCAEVTAQCGGVTFAVPFMHPWDTETPFPPRYMGLSFWNKADNLDLAEGRFWAGVRLAQQLVNAALAGDLDITPRSLVDLTLLAGSIANAQSDLIAELLEAPGVSR